MLFSFRNSKHDKPKFPILHFMIQLNYVDAMTSVSKLLMSLCIGYKRISDLNSQFLNILSSYKYLIYSQSCAPIHSAHPMHPMQKLLISFLNILENIHKNMNAVSTVKACFIFMFF